MSFKNLSLRWSKRHKDFIVYHPRKCDGILAMNLFTMKQYSLLDNNFGPSFIEELESRGYDTTTLVFTVKAKKSLPLSTPGGDGGGNKV